ncbi:MAG: hypothetical protein LBQ66_05135, partial [Planctomycetaceae bacterium]|nr:hypothetical protein [Planctomycetaceae bacterium]
LIFYQNRSINLNGHHRKKKFFTTKYPPQTFAQRIFLHKKIHHAKPINLTIPVIKQRTHHLARSAYVIDY